MRLLNNDQASYIQISSLNGIAVSLSRIFSFTDIIEIVMDQKSVTFCLQDNDQVKWRIDSLSKYKLVHIIAIFSKILYYDLFNSLLPYHRFWITLEFYI